VVLYGDGILYGLIVVSGAKTGSGIRGGKSTTKAPQPESGVHKREDICRLTEIVDMLLSNGELNIYEMTREAVELSDMKWEYQGQDGSIHGPYSSAEIATWQFQGYLTGPTSVFIRRAREGGSDTAASIPGESGPDRKRARTAHEEVLGDFEDGDDDDDTTKEPVVACAVVDKYVDWVSSDTVEFAEALPPSDVNGGGRSACGRTWEV
jgi:hypothetical protein